MQDRRSYISQTAVFYSGTVIVCYIYEWYRVQRVRCIRCTVGINGVIRITVVGNNDSFVTGLLGCLDDLFHTVVYCPYSFCDGIVNACMAYHVTICEVDYDEIVLIVLDSSYQFVFYLISTHLTIDYLGFFRAKDNSVSGYNKAYLQVPATGDWDKCVQLGNETSIINTS